MLPHLALADGKEAMTVKDLILGLAIVGIVIFGAYLMKRVDRFLKHNYKIRRIEPDLGENGIVIFNRPNAPQEEEHKEDAKGNGAPEEDAQKKDGPNCGKEHSKCRESKRRPCICRLCRGFML